MTNGRVREWVGPRIIPVFADTVEWDIDSTYEPLMMVQSEGETYMSRQYVPADVNLPNVSGEEESNDYWVHMSNWNAQVEYYRQEVLAFDGRIDALEDALPISAFDSEDTVDSHISAIEADSWVTTAKIADEAVTTAKIDDEAVTTAKINDGAVTTAKIPDEAVTTAKIDDGAVTTAKIANGAVTRSKLTEEYFVLFGDSWTDFDSPIIYNWYEINHFSEILDVTLKNFGVGGAGFTAGTSLIGTQLTTANGTLTAEEKANTKYVCFVGGVNDVQNNSQGITDPQSWYGTVGSCFNTAHTMFPNAVIIYCPDICALDGGSDKAKNCMYYSRNFITGSLPYVDAPVIVPPNMPYFFPGHTSDEVFQSDNLHLNLVGARAYGKNILAACTGSNLSIVDQHYNINGLDLTINTTGRIFAGGSQAPSTTSGSITIPDALKEFIIYWNKIYPDYCMYGTNGPTSSGTDKWMWLRTTGSGALNFGATDANASYYF